MHSFYTVPLTANASAMQTPSLAPNPMFLAASSGDLNAAIRPAAVVDKAPAIVVALRDEATSNAVVPSSGKALAYLADLANAGTCKARQLNAALLSPSKVRLLNVERPPDNYVAALKAARSTNNGP